MEKKKKIFIPPVPAIPWSESLTDPQGSYTGLPVVPDEKPVQDVDDL